MMQLFSQIAHYLFPYASMGTGWIIFGLVANLLTLAAIFGLHKGIRQNVGRLGGLAIFPILLMIAFTLVSLVIGLVNGMMISLLVSLPILGSLLAFFPALVKLISYILTFSLCGYVVWYSLTRIDLIWRFFHHTVMKPMEGAFNKWHIFAGAMAVALAVNSPALNQWLYFAPSVISCLVGLYTIVVVRPNWLAIGREIAKDYVRHYQELPYGLEVQKPENRRLVAEAVFEAELQDESMTELEEYLDPRMALDDFDRRLADSIAERSQPTRITTQEVYEEAKRILRDQKVRIRLEDELAEEEAEAEALAGAEAEANK
jgi:hypothetical protein